MDSILCQNKIFVGYGGLVRSGGFRDGSFREGDRFGNGDRFNGSPRSGFNNNSSRSSVDNSVDNTASAVLSAAMGLNHSKGQTERRKGFYISIFKKRLPNILTL